MTHYNIVYHKVMNLTIRQNENRMRTFKTSAFDNSLDDSKFQSNSSKRFARKKNNSKQQLSNSKSKYSQKFISIINFESQPSQNDKNQADSFASGHVDLALKLTHTPIKRRNYVTSLSSDRATESTYLLGRYQNEYKLTDKKIFDSKRQNFSDLKADLDIKINEVMILQDENMKLKRDISLKESQFYQLNSKHLKQQQKLRNQETQYHKDIDNLTYQLKQLKEQVELLRQEIKSKNLQIKEMKKTQNTATRQLKSIKFEKLMLQKQLEDIYKRKLPKELKEIMSFRQISLMNQIDELKEMVQKDKSKIELHLEQENRRLKQEVNEKVKESKHLQVFNRILNKKIDQNQKQMNQKIQNFSRCYNNLKLESNDMQQKIKCLKKQNLKMKRLNMLSYKNINKSAKSITYSSSSQSLSLQLSIS